MGIGSAGKAAKAAQEEAINLQRTAAAEAKAAREAAANKMQTATDTYKMPTYLESAEAQKYKKTLEDRMSGLGLIDVNALTSPIADQVRAGLKETTANIGAGASARGLGRSTVATSQIGEASKAAERDIAERMSNLELTRQQQIQDAVSGYGTLTKDELESQQTKQDFARSGEFAVASTQAGNADAAKADQYAIAQAIAQRGLTEASNREKNQAFWYDIIKTSIGAVAGAMTGGASTAATATNSGVSSLTSQDTMDYLSQRFGVSSRFGQSSALVNR